ncbi:MAG: hypothetical protein KKB20_09175 [Proteobacteria bacterium]|nr:hypothetical protein [Pseudomonadota bacterium]
MNVSTNETAGCVRGATRRDWAAGLGGCLLLSVCLAAGTGNAGWLELKTTDKTGNTRTVIEKEYAEQPAPTPGPPVVEPSRPNLPGIIRHEVIKKQVIPYEPPSGQAVSETPAERLDRLMRQVETERQAPADGKTATPLSKSQQLRMKRKARLEARRKAIEERRNRAKRSRSGSRETLADQ